MITERFDLGGVDLDRTLRVLDMLPHDPTLRLQPGRLVRVTHTPEGAGTLTADWTTTPGTVVVTTHGPGDRWLMERAPGALGLLDGTYDDFDPAPGPLRQLWRQHPGQRVARTGTLWHDLCWLIVQQRVQRLDAAGSWRRLVERHGSPAPDHPELLTPPAPDRIAGIPVHEFHGLGIERRRADTLRAAARTSIDLGGLADRSVAEGARLLETLPGVGPWTTSTLAAVTWGDPDAVIVGDSGIPHLVCWVLAGEQRASDGRMLDLLEPHRPHRYRVLQLAFASGRRPPRTRPHPRRSDISRI